MAYDLNVRELFLAVWQLFVLVVSDPHAFHHLPNGDAHVSLAFVGAFTGWTCWNACQLALSSGRIPSLQSNVSAVPGRKSFRSGSLPSRTQLFAKRAGGPGASLARKWPCFGMSAWRRALAY